MMKKNILFVFSILLSSTLISCGTNTKFHVVTFDSHGGSNVPSQKVAYGDKVEKPDNPTRLGYNFVNWTYQDEEWLFIGYSVTQDMTLDANWSIITYNVIYNLDGGTNDSNNPSSYTVEDDLTLYAPIKTGYTFLGWFNETNSEIKSLGQTIVGDMTLTAHWSIVTYNIIYELDGGTNDPNNHLSYTVEDNFALNNPIKTGYTFLGWFNETNSEIKSLGQTIVGDMTLTAHWTANLNSLSVTSEDTSKGTAAITSGSGYSEESITVVATPVGDCVFKGWYHENTKVSNDTTYTFTMPTNDYSLVAHFFTKAEEEAWNIAHGVIPTLSEDGKTITYGLYPQTNVNDSTLVSTLNALTTPESNGWYLYNDEYYAKLSATPYKTNYYTFDNGTTIVSETTYWFKCEPIKWNVLSNTNGEYYILSSVLLDAHCYYDFASAGYLYDEYRKINGEKVYHNNYEYSDIRTWLNNDFYNSAFALDNSYIQTTTVDNSASTTNSSTNSFACNNTQDKVFLPSYKDYINSTYGFSTSTSSTDTRYCKTTDWARARGASGGSYWTRSPYSGRPYDYYYFVWYVDANGKFFRTYANYTHWGVRPSLSIKIA